MNLPVFLLISKDPGLRHLLQTAFPQSSIHSAGTASEGLILLAKISPSLVVGEGSPHTLVPLLEYARQSPGFPPVVAIGDRDSVKDAVEIMRAGAADCLTKPILLEDLQTAIARALHQPCPVPSFSPHDPFASIISVSPQMNLMKQLAKEVASSDATVLISGESGTGKELFAEAIHRESPRAAGPLVALNCAGIPENLLEAELFGYESGAFTDAKRAKPGRFQLAEGGTLFLDEIGEIPLSMQVKLLRAVQEREVREVGSEVSTKIDVRIIAATNKDLGEAVKNGSFRNDLYYRISVVPLFIPPLRDRRDDIPLLAQQFLTSSAKRANKSLRGFTPAALNRLVTHLWPGNVRELENIIEKAAVMTRQDMITPDLLPSMGASPDAPLKPLTEAKEEFEKTYLKNVLQLTGGNISRAAQFAGRYRADFYKMLKKYGLHPSTLKAKAEADLGELEEEGDLTEAER